jgi:hypothetical protein
MYNCYKCLKKFYIQSIAAHITVNHFEAALKCGEEGCGRRCDNPIAFRKHLKTHHIIIVPAETSESLMLVDEFEDIIGRPEERPLIPQTPPPALSPAQSINVEETGFRSRSRSRRSNIPRKLD